jgi:hypothetical protein
VSTAKYLPRFQKNVYFVLFSQSKRSNTFLLMFNPQNWGITLLRNFGKYSVVTPLRIESSLKSPWEPQISHLWPCQELNSDILAHGLFTILSNKLQGGRNVPVHLWKKELYCAGSEKVLYTHHRTWAQVAFVTCLWRSLPALTADLSTVHYLRYPTADRCKGTSRSPCGNLVSVCQVLETNR